ncbi:hydroquinone glucosyltransferase-like [Trifolium pratense]|uniref:hydroquinone glucosyltransferase-like n=1 Tax=Trifolium pratense TaxID=57577 RepID=UPI001E6954C2|nr:hydroquinone glucosyltransferase-like [Trifolium pratense]
MAQTIVVTSIPQFSHQSSIIKFSKRLIHLHNQFHVTCIFPTIDAPIPATLKLLDSLPSSITCTFLPPINKQDLPQDGPLQILLAVSQSMPAFRDSLISLRSSTLVVSIVADLLVSQALEIAKEFNLFSFIYFPLSAMVSSLHLHLLSLHEQISCEYIDHTEPILIPGCVPIRGQDLPSVFLMDRSSLVYELVLRHTKNFSLADGVLVNSFLEMEENTMRALTRNDHNNNKTQLVYLVGPILQTGLETEPKGSDCEKWLENQTQNSVLYVCFGSGGTLSQEQINELAFGLELSGVKFLWVLREPSNSKNVDYQSASNDDDNILKFLPQGFLERTKEHGLVVPFWAPQTQILSHTSIGGFLTHCGWNSILESIMLGVPMITWPLFADQRMNAILLIESLKVGLEVKFNENGIAEREEISNVIRDLMLGEKRSVIQQKIEELKDVAKGALGEDGSSTRTLSQFVTTLMESHASHE